MSLTLFFPFFILMVINAMRGPNQWAGTLAFAAFFQSATPILLNVGGRFSGIAPAFCLLFIGVWHVYGSYYSAKPYKPAARQFPYTTFFLAAFAIVGISGALFLPRLLAGMVDVLPPRSGLDSGITAPLKASGGNYIQSFYLLCILSLFWMLKHLLQRGVIQREAIFKGLIAGAAFSVFLGFYQIIGFSLGLPWPSAIINSNIGVSQLQNQTALGIKRMSATFVEPSILATHYLGMVALLYLGLNRKLLGGALLFALLLSTSSTAYFGLVALVAVWVFVGKSKGSGNQVFLTLGLLCLAVLLALSMDFMFANGNITDRLVLNKLEGQSGNARLNADLLALKSFYESFGFGTGVGSARASSLPASLAATVGWPGVVLFFSFVGALMVPLCRSDNREDKALFLGMTGFLIAWLISAPDLNFPVFWILAALGAHANATRPAKAVQHTRPKNYANT